MKKRPRCPGCGFEFKLLTILGIKEVKGMWCLQCEALREKLGKQVKDWEEMDKRIKARILPKVKGNSWMEVGKWKLKGSLAGCNLDEGDKNAGPSQQK